MNISREEFRRLAGTVSYVELKDEIFDGGGMKGPCYDVRVTLRITHGKDRPRLRVRMQCSVEGGHWYVNGLGLEGHGDTPDTAVDDYLLKLREELAP